MQRRSSHHDVEPSVAQLDLADVAPDGRDAASGRAADPFPGPVEHRLAEVNQGGIEVGQLQVIEMIVHADEAGNRGLPRPIQYLVAGRNR